LFGQSPSNYNPNDPTPPFIQDYKQRLDPHGIMPLAEAVDDALERASPIATDAFETALDMVPFYGTYRLCSRGEALGCGISAATDVVILLKIAKVLGVAATLGRGAGRGTGIRTLTDAELAEIRGGMLSRKAALIRLEGLAPEVEIHLAKIARSPGSRDVAHWRHEIVTWLRDMEAVLPAVGKKTGSEWEKRIQIWRQALGE
jgi:hypothetical protein